METTKFKCTIVLKYSRKSFYNKHVYVVKFYTKREMKLHKKNGKSIY